MMTPLERDDLTHLLLSCRLRSDLSSGLRYAYARLDTIDRKSSELFRSFTFITGGLIALCSLMSRHDLHVRMAAFGSDAGDPSGRSVPVVLLFLGMAFIAISAWRLLRTNVDISRLSYHRIAEAKLSPDAAVAACRSDGVMLGKDAGVDAVFTAYLAEITCVTVAREQRLRSAAVWYEAGVICAAVCVACILFIALTDPGP